MNKVEHGMLLLFETLIWIHVVIWILLDLWNTHSMGKGLSSGENKTSVGNICYCLCESWTNLRGHRCRDETASSDFDFFDSWVLADSNCSTQRWVRLVGKYSLYYSTPLETLYHQLVSDLETETNEVFPEAVNFPAQAYCSCGNLVCNTFNYILSEIKISQVLNCENNAYCTSICWSH